VGETFIDANDEVLNGSSCKRRDREKGAAVTERALVDQTSNPLGKPQHSKLG